MNTVLKQLRVDVRDLIVKGSQVRKDISSLKWKEGSLPEVQKLRSQRDASGHRFHGKRSLVSFRRPETGAQRSGLWDKKREIGWDARNLFLIYGMLRGRLYSTMEKNCVCAPSAFGLEKCLDKYFGESSIKESAIQDWISGGAAPEWRTGEQAA
jgi:hypothetical protein